ncbi:heparan sulfate glucosamine 3-O-sulfotransferase 5 [Brachionus plicatilis]|uniref:Heparan sulfate glucosamine 3-O-sulfotransferase 5 n=1 Tax=Brachionus plicatilis TaxID=10195 RepID=A0A3M7PJ30_BRAPC|nr:heparan sulfate glucosamine 3-O-sulfotransferase 5 [Brachionus plicatilis]
MFLFSAYADESGSQCKYLERKLPGAVIIGVKKSGTYALLRYLSLNERVRPALKENGCNLNEIHFFDSDLNYSFGLEWYKKQMPLVCKKTEEKDYVVIEKTPGYFRSEKAPERIKKFDQNMKVILIVRNPVKRLQSELTHCDHRQKKLGLNRKCLKMNDFFENVFLNGNQSDLFGNKFVRNSLYYLDLKKWLRLFKINESLHVVDGDSFIQRPWLELSKIEIFLNLPNKIQRDNFIYDEKKNFYCLNETDGQNCLGKNKGRKEHVYLSQFVKSKLEIFFNKWNFLLFDLIGKNFNW